MTDEQGAGAASDDVRVERVERVDPDDAGALAAWHGVFAAALRAAAPDHPVLTLPELTALVRRGPAPIEHELWLLRAGGRPVGAARLDVFLRDNTDLVEVHLGVDPAEQHRGHGRRLVEAVKGRAAELGRHQVVGEVQEPPDGSENRAMRFAAAAGARRALGEMRRVLDLTTLSDDLLARLRAEAEENATGYSLVTWAGRVPDEHADGYARLLGRISADAPHGDLDLEASVWDAERVRQREALLESQGRRSVAALARVGQDGPLVAYSDVGVSSHDPDNTFQWDTLVQPEHRGHRLGLLVKVAVLELLRTEAPRARYLHTWNADDNGYMIAINDKLGFRPAQRESAWRLDLPR
ncbi:MAG TPA: GNAT family N-acetyltransferase [Actinomycetes bacterium]|nr:GNAT family N-acetyltransferase [Actinomycetes bacterium]